MTNILGLDIGGANIKACDLNSKAISLVFPLWKQSEQLTAAIQELIAQYDNLSSLAVTMTGELADCFASKSEGVSFIVRSVEDAIRETQIGAPYWQTSGEFVDAETATEFPLLTAAANWHLLATWAGRMSPYGTALLIDIGSTTTDIIPIEDGLPASRGLNDLERLQTGELLYQGVRRTPLMTMGSTIDLDGQTTRIAAELFATMDDVFLVLGSVPEAPDQHDTADGKPRTCRYAEQRLARMICSDTLMTSSEQIRSLCTQWEKRFVSQLLDGLNQVLTRRPQPSMILTSGEGEFVIERALNQFEPLLSTQRISLMDALGSDVSNAACAHAAAQVASERP